MKRMIIRPFLLFTFILFLVSLASGPLEGQVHYRFFYGKIFAYDNHEPVSNVNISFQGSKLGSLTDQKGAFSFYIDTIPVFMIVSHLGFKTKKIFLDGSSFSMTIYLEREIRELKEVEVRANKVEPFFRSERYTLRDYEIDSGRVFLLVFRNRISKEEVICRDVNGDTISRSGILPFSPVSLYKDCLGYLHVLGKDSVYQLFREGKDIKMIYPESKAKFDEVLLNCLASTNRILLYKSMFGLGQGVVYYWIDRFSKDKKMLSMVTDDYKMKLLRLNPGDAARLSTNLPGGRSADNSIQGSDGNSLNQDRASFDEWNWVHKALYRPMKTALFRIGEYICIFDIPGKKLELYDLSGNFSEKLKLNIDVIKDGKWTAELFLDESQSKVYTTFQRSSGTSLYRIDLNSGDLKKILTVIHAFPQKIKIYNDKIYYLYDIPGDPENNTLFRQDL